MNTLVVIQSLICSTVLLLSATPFADDLSQHIISGKRVGPVTSTTSEAELKKHLGHHVTSGTLPDGEGGSMRVTVVYSKDRSRRLFVVWKDAAKRRYPRQIIINDRESVWRIAADVGIGTTLQELEQKNGKPFTLGGFGWDYEGTVCSWEGGKLTQLFEHEGKILLRLRNVDEQREENRQQMDIVPGDHCYSSSTTAMQKLNPRVYEMVVIFDQ